MNNDFKMLKYLEETYDTDELINFTTKTGYNLLEFACKNNKPEMLKYLHNKYKWDMTHATSEGNNLFHTACTINNIDMLEYITNIKDLKPFIKRQNNEKLDAYYIALMSGNLDIMDYLVDDLNWVVKHDEVMKFAKLVGASTDIFVHLRKIKILADFPLIKNKSNDTCIVCCDKFVTDDAYCKCVNNHIIHKSCYIEFLGNNPHNANKDYKCVYCQQQVIGKSYLFE